MIRLAVATAAVVLLAVASLAGWLALASQTSASAEVRHSRGAGADAAFVTVAECTWVDIWVSAGSWVDQVPPGKPLEGSGLMVGIDVWWICLQPGVVGTLADPDTGDRWTDPADVSAWRQADRPEDAQLITSFWGWTDAASVEIGQGYASADGVVTVCDMYFPDVCVDMDVSVDWDAAGGASVSGWHSHDNVCNSRNHSGWREATASGTIRPLVPGMEPLPNLIPDPAVYASVGVWQSGAVCKA